MRDLVLVLARHGVSSTVLVHRYQPSLTTRHETHTFDGQSVFVIRVATWFKAFFAPISPFFPWHLRRAIAAFQPDLLHLHLPNPSAFWALALPRARLIPWVVHWHADVVTAALRWPMRIMYAGYRPFERALLKRAAAIITTSARYRDTSAPLQPWLAKCHVVPLGLDSSRLGHAAQDQPVIGGQDSGLRVLAIGRLTYYKGFRYLIEATAAMEDLQLDLVGDGDQADELKNLVATLKLEERVTFHGAAEDSLLATLLARCDCLCLPSIERTEAFGMVLLEAMSFGKATVVSDVPGSGMGWIVEQGVTGLKVKPCDSVALAAAFRHLTIDRHTLQKMGRAGREKFERTFEINQAVRGVLETYRSVLGEIPTATEQIEGR